VARLRYDKKEEEKMAWLGEGVLKHAREWHGSDA